MKTLAELAESQGISFKGNGKVTLGSVATIENADSNQIAFLANSNYSKFLKTTQAGAVILTAQDAEKYSGNCLISENPYVTFAHIAQLFDQLNQSLKSHNREIHNSAIISTQVKLGSDVGIGALSFLDDEVSIGNDTVVESHVSIGKGVQIGQNCHIKAGVKLEAGTQIGNRVIIHPGAVIGADGFGLARDKEGWVKIPQTGYVEIGDDCEIGANTTVDCGAIENTVLGHDVRLDNQIQIGHNVHIGDHTVIAGCTAVAGSAKIGKNCFIGGGVGIVGHIEICDGVTIQAMALVTHSITKPDSYSSVPPLQPTKQWRRNAVRSRQLDQIAKRLKQLEKKING